MTLETTRAALGFPAPPTPEALAALPGVLQAPLTGPGGRPSGTLFVQGSDAPPDPRAQGMLAAIAAQASLAITNARLYEQSLRHAGNLRSLARRVAEAVAASDDLGRVAAPVAEQAVSLLACASSGVYLLSEDRQMLMPAASFPADAARGTGAVAGGTLLDTLWTATTPLAFEDARVLGEVWAEVGTHGLIVAPLRGPTQGLLGALTLRWTARHRAGEEELSLAAALAGFAAVAVENARLASDARTARQALTEKNARLLDETRAARRGTARPGAPRRGRPRRRPQPGARRPPGRRAGPADDPLPPRRLPCARRPKTGTGRARCARWPSPARTGTGGGPTAGARKTSRS